MAGNAAWRGSRWPSKCYGVAASIWPGVPRICSTDFAIFAPRPVQAAACVTRTSSLLAVPDLWSTTQESPARAVGFRGELVRPFAGSRATNEPCEPLEALSSNYQCNAERAASYRRFESHQLQFH